jgi:Protein of unknown function (DUF1458).
MQEYLKIFRGLGILLVLCVMLSTMAFSEDKTKATDNQTNTTNMTEVNASENQTVITNMTELNASESQAVITNMTEVNASENMTSSLNSSEIVGVVSGASINILTGTSSVSWEEAVQNIVTAVDAMGQQVKAVQVLKFDVKLENGKIAVYEATVLLTY